MTDQPRKTFAEHLEDHRNDDGSYDLQAAEDALTEQLAEDHSAIHDLARKAAKTERARWERNETAILRKQFGQPALSPELELEVLVPLGGSTAVELGYLEHARIRVRKDLRTRIHMDESRAFNDEMTFWLRTESMLEPGETIGEAIARLGNDAA